MTKLCLKTHTPANGYTNIRTFLPVTTCPIETPHQDQHYVAPTEVLWKRVTGIQPDQQSRTQNTGKVRH